MVEDDVLVWTAVVVSAQLIQRTPVTAPHTADTRQTPETHTTAFSVSSITDLDSDKRNVQHRHCAYVTYWELWFSRLTAMQS